MITNNNLIKEYGQFNISLNRNSVPPVFKPAPVDEDYKKGYIERYFIVKHSDKSGHEIDPSASEDVDTFIYSIVKIVWRIKGKKHFTKVGTVIEDYGVSEQNLSQINNVKIDTGISLSPFLKNPLEFWKS
jgi:hypothetical protein